MMLPSRKAATIGICETKTKSANVASSSILHSANSVRSTILYSVDVIYGIVSPCQTEAILNKSGRW